MKSKRTKATRKITMLLAMTMLSEQLVSTGAVLYAHAEDVTSAEYTIEHGVTSSWDGGCTAEIILTNKADVDTEKWSVSFCTCDEITNLWGGQITDCQEITESYYGEGRVEVFEENKEEVLSETDNYREETEVAPLEDEVDKETEASEDVASEEKINDTEEAETDFTDVLEEKAEEEAYAVLSEEALEVDIVEFDETEVFKEIEDEAKHYYSYTVECLDYNATIPAGGSVRIGYSANGKEHDIWDEKATIEYKKDEAEEKTIPVGGIYVGEGYTVEVVVPAYWENAYNVQLKITNISEEIIHNWAFVMETADDIVNLYNAVELSNKEGVRLIKNVGYNQDIPVGGTIEVGYTASYEKNADVPSGFALSQIEKEVTTTECEVSLFLTDEWEDGGLAQILIENKSDMLIEDWTLEFDSAQEIIDIWGGVIESHEGEHYFIRNAEYAQNILSGESWTIGFLFDGEAPDIQNVEVKQVIVDKTSVPGISKGDSTSNIRYMDTTPSEYTEDIGKVYFKEIDSSADIVCNIEGLTIVRDQILLVAKSDITYDQIEKLVADNEAKIVGYIELSGDYQIELNVEVDAEKLEEIRGNLLSSSYVERADYNYVSETDFDFHTDEKSRTDGVRFLQSGKNGLPIDTDGWDAEWTDDNPSGSNWGIEAIKMTGALINAGVIENYGSNSEDINLYDLNYTRIGVIDNYFDTDHEDLHFCKTWNNPDGHENLIRVDSDYENNAHGTHTAGIMAAGFDNGIGIAGVCPKNHLYGFSMWGDTCSDYTKSELGRYVDGFKYRCALAVLIANKVRVINCSMGYGTIAFGAAQGEDKALLFIQKETEIMDDFLIRMLDRGYDFLIVNSSGNSNDDAFCFSYQKAQESDTGFMTISEYKNNPGKYLIENIVYMMPKAHVSDDWKEFEKVTCSGNLALYHSRFLYSTNERIKERVICVGAAYNDIGKFYSCSDYSDGGDRVDILAPGDSIYNCIPKNESDFTYGDCDGTSMAAPYVAGIAGFMLSVNDDLSCKDIKEIIISSQDKRNMITYGVGMLDAEAAINKAVDFKGENKAGERYCIVCGNTMEYSNGSNGEMLPEVIVNALTVDGEEIAQTISDRNGYYEMILPEGCVQICFSKEGYSMKRIYVDLRLAEVTVADTVYMEKERIDLESYNVILTVIDKETGEALPNAYIFFVPSVMVGGTSLSMESDKASRIYEVDGEGVLLTNLEEDSYSAIVHCEGYCPLCVGVSTWPKRNHVDTIELERDDPSDNCTINVSADMTTIPNANLFCAFIPNPGPAYPCFARTLKGKYGNTNSISGNISTEWFVEDDGSIRTWTIKVFRYPSCLYLYFWDMESSEDAVDLFAKCGGRVTYTDSAYRMHNLSCPVTSVGNSWNIMCINENLEYNKIEPRNSYFMRFGRD